MLEIAGDPGDCWRTPHRYYQELPGRNGLQSIARQIVTSTLRHVPGVVLKTIGLLYHYGAGIYCLLPNY
eukprot:580595-Amorphochlora_amoeboformis.AAC.1